MQDNTARKANRVPDHVPPELVWDHSLNRFTAELDDPFVAAGRLHEGPAIIWATEASLGKPGWVITRHGPMQEAFMDYQHFSSTRDSSTGEVLGDVVRMIPVEVDPPEHHLYRRILQPYFTPQAVSEMGDMVQGTCDRLMDRIEDPLACDFIEDFAAIFPNSIFLSLLGLPQEELPRFLAWERTLLRAGDEGKHAEAQAAAAEIFRYLHGFVQEQRPAPGAEFMKGLMAANIGDRPINEAEILGTCFLFYVAGLDTVYSTLGWIMRHLAMDQALQDRLRRNPGEIPRAVDEFTRAFGVAAPHRRVTRDVTFNGVFMKEGDVVLLPTYLASRDPAVYPEPHRIDIDRGARGITFATGPHTCLGIHLAKRELRIVLESFLARFSRIGLQPDNPYHFHTGGVLGVDRLPLVLEK